MEIFLSACANRHKASQFLHPVKHYLLFFLALLSLSQSANLVRWAAAPALMIGFWRLIGASGMMFGLRLFNARRTGEAFLQPVSKSTWAWALLSGTFFFLHLWTFFYAAQNTTIANCMVIFSTNPIFIAIGAWMLLKDRFEKRHAQAFVLAFTGVAILVSDRLSWDTARTGDFSALVSAIFVAAYMVTGKRARLHMNNDQYTGAIYLWTALLFLLAGTIQQVQWTGYPDHTWWAILATILFPTLLGHVLMTHLLKHFNINWMSCGKLLEPAFSAIVAFLAFKEVLKIQTIISFGFTAAAVLILFGPLLFQKKPLDDLTPPASE